MLHLLLRLLRILRAHLSSATFRCGHLIIVLWAALKRRISKWRGMHGDLLGHHDEAGRDSKSWASFRGVESDPFDANVAVICPSNLPQIQLSMAGTSFSNYLSIGHTSQNASRTSHDLSIATSEDLSDNEDEIERGSMAHSHLSATSNGPCQPESPVLRGRLPRAPSPAIMLSPPNGSGPASSTISLTAIPIGDSAASIEYKPITTHEVKRYNKKITVPVRKEEYIIRPKTLPNEQGHLAPAGWTAQIHPEGALYYYNEDKRISTEADISDGAILRKVTYCADALLTELPNLPPDSELVLELDGPDDATVCGYYFASMEERTLFWLHEYGVGSVLEQLQGSTSSFNIRHVMEALFWSHVEMFPNHYKIPNDIIDELLSIILHANMDTLTSNYSTSPYDTGQTQIMISNVKHVQDICSRRRTANYDDAHSRSHLMCNAASTVIIGRLMNIFAHNRFLNYHGERCARLSSDQAIYPDGDPRTTVIKIFSLLFFGAPDTHFKRFKEEIWVDRIVHQKTWRQHLMRMKDEWIIQTTLATVMLTANVGFLAIQSVDKGDGQFTSAGIGSFYSTLMSVGCIIVGLVLLRRNPTGDDGDVSRTDEYLSSHGRQKHGLELLAIMYSTPYGLLMWAVIAFLVALALLSFELFDDIPSKSTKSRLIIAIAWISALGIALWTLDTDSDYAGTTRSSCQRLSCWYQTIIIRARSALELRLKLPFWLSTRAEQDTNMDLPQINGHV